MNFVLFCFGRASQGTKSCRNDFSML